MENNSNFRLSCYKHNFLWDLRQNFAKGFLVTRKIFNSDFILKIAKKCQFSRFQNITVEIFEFSVLISRIWEHLNCSCLSSLTAFFRNLFSHSTCYQLSGSKVNLHLLVCRRRVKERKKETRYLERALTNAHTTLHLHTWSSLRPFLIFHRKSGRFI